MIHLEDAVIRDFICVSLSHSIKITKQMEDLEDGWILLKHKRLVKCNENEQLFHK